MYSYEQKAVNLPGWLFSSAIFTFSFQIEPATSGLMKAFTGVSAEHVHEVRERLLNIRLVIGVLEDKRLCCGQLTHGRSRRVRFFRYAHVFRVVGHTHEIHGRVDLDVIAQGCLMVWPCAYFRASSGPVRRLPMSQASTDQLVWMCSSPK